MHLFNIRRSAAGYTWYYKVDTDRYKFKIDLNSHTAKINEYTSPARLRPCPYCLKQSYNMEKIKSLQCWREEDVA